MERALPSPAGGLVTGPSEPVFRVSSFCVSGECVAVGFIPGRVLVRHHGDPGQTLDFSNAEWMTFVAGVRRGEFDDVMPAASHTNQEI